MLSQLAWRIWRTTDGRCLRKFLWNFGVKGVISVEKFKRRLKKGIYFPPFLHISVINSCNLRCQGCWVDVEARRTLLDIADLKRLVGEANAHGNSFFGILGGEPLLHPQLFELFRAFPGCYFQLFTNGQFITKDVAAELRRLGNVTPLISIEGGEISSDIRRGGRQVFQKTLQGLERCVEAGLLTGVATSVCKSNMGELLTETWLVELIRRGVHYVWYYGYRPSGPRMNQELALSAQELLRLRQFVVEMRARLPIVLVDAYYDHDGRALCPMVTGMSHHINPRGDIEPCPVLQVAVENIRDKRGIYETMTGSAFLREFRELSARVSRGCVILERPDLVLELARKHGARDSTLRGTVFEELSAMKPRFSQWQPGREIPEKHWVYRLAKRWWYNDFGAYRRLEPDAALRVAAMEKAEEAQSKPIVGEARPAELPLCPQ